MEINGEFCTRWGGKILGAKGVKDTTRNFAESTELGSQGITETEAPISVAT